MIGSGLAVTLSIVPLFLGVLVVINTRWQERRWATIGTLALALVGQLLVGWASQWGQQPLSWLGLHFDGMTATVGPAMVLGSATLVLSAGRQEASDTEYAWLLGLLALELTALSLADILGVIAAEAAATLLLVLHARRRGHRAHLAYLSASGLLLCGAAALIARSGGVVTTPTAIVIGIAAFVRLGVWPFSTGALASLRRGPSISTLLGVLPFGGVTLLRVASAVPTPDVLLLSLLVSAPIAAALATRQRELGRSLGYMLAALHALICFGALAPLDSAQVGSELLWAGALVTSCGFGGAVHLVALRLGSPDLSEHHGLHTNAPFLSLAFLLLGVGIAGAPGTVEFVAEDILVNVVGAELPRVALIVVTLGLIGWNVLRLHFRVFFGRRAAAHPYLAIKGRERLGLSLAIATILLGGFLPAVLPLLAGGAGH